jgi:hypothetical protein
MMGTMTGDEDDVRQRLSDARTFVDGLSGNEVRAALRTYSAIPFERIYPTKAPFTVSVDGELFTVTTARKRRWWRRAR